MTGDAERAAARERGAAPGHTRAVLDLTIRLAEVVFAAGAGAEEATTAMTAVARAYGLRGTESDVTHTVLSLTWTNPSTTETISRSRNVKYRLLNYARLSKTSALIAQIVASPPPVNDAHMQLAEIVRSKPQVPRLVRRIGWSLVGAGAALLLGGGLFVALVAAVATFAVDGFTTVLARHRVPLFYQMCAGAAIGPVAAMVVSLVKPEAPASLVVVATIIMLLAGVTIFGAVHDTLSGFYLTGTARIVEAIVITAGVVTGVSGASLLIDRIGLPIALSGTVIVSVGTVGMSLVAALVIVIGFSLAVQVPWRAFWVVGALGMLAELAYLITIGAGFGPIWGSGVAALAVGTLATLLAGLSRTPPLALVVTGLIPLVPGLALYNGLMLLAEGSVEGVLKMLTAASVAGALAAGAILGQYLMQLAWGPTKNLKRRFGGPVMVLPVRFGRVRKPRADRAGWPGVVDNDSHPH